MDSAIRFYNWAFKTRANTVKKLSAGEQMSPDKIFLSFCSHDPTLITNGPAGLNASIKGVGFVPKKEYLEYILNDKFIPHIKSFDPNNHDEYSNNGLKLLIDCLYGDEAEKNVDFTKLCTLEMAKNHTYQNILANTDPKGCPVTYSFYQPPAIAFEVRGRAELQDDGIYKNFVNAEHDVYHTPNMERWVTRPVIVTTIDTIFDNGTSRSGFGKQLQYPPVEWDIK